MYENLKKEVELVWEDHDHIRDDQAKIAIRETVRLLDEGQICLLYTSPSPRD